MEEIDESQKFDSDFTCEYTKNDVTVLCRGREIFRITFNPENFAEAHPERFLSGQQLTEAQIDDLVRALAASGEEVSQSETARRGTETLRSIHLTYALYIAEFISKNLCELARLC